MSALDPAEAYDRHTGRYATKLAAEFVRFAGVERLRRGGRNHRTWMATAAGEAAVSAVARAGTSDRRSLLET